MKINKKLKKILDKINQVEDTYVDGDPSSWKQSDQIGKVTFKMSKPKKKKKNDYVDGDPSSWRE